MTVIANTYLSYSAIGNREDLADVIYNISPTDTPFMGNIGKNKATATLHEWQTDALAAAAANAKIEGDDTTFAAAVPTTRLTNRCQISRKEVIISETQDVVNKAGRRREMVYQLTKRSKELKRDMEFVLTNNQLPQGGSSTAARQLRPLVGWYSTNVIANGGSNGSASAIRTDGTQRAFTESLLKEGLRQAWEAGGTPDMVMLGSFNKQVASGFTGNATRMDDSKDKKLIAAVDVYESDFGPVKFVPSRFQRGRDAHVIDTEYWSIANLRPMKTVDLAKTGDADKAHIIVEYTLQAKNEAASALIADLSTS